MADSEEVLERFHASLPAGAAPPEITAIVVNEKGVERALAARGMATLGYPYSISAYFRRANANMSRSESRALVEQMRAATRAAGRDMVVYISMAFGNPYDEPWGPEVVEDTLVWLKDVGVRTVSLADTVGTATAPQVHSLYAAVKGCVAGIELGVHLHSRPDGAAEKVMAAYNAGCRRFDSALIGMGGCPFAGDELVGNIPTETVVRTLTEHRIDCGLELAALTPAMVAAQEIRDKYARLE
jgi:hydroxymethylglutaryl-CoA lyase